MTNLLYRYILTVKIFYSYSMTLCLIAIFKNESCIMKEWLEHYTKEGVDHFYLIDNGSNDDYSKIINPYIDSKKVTLVVDVARHQQTELYNKYFLEESKVYDWVIVCDLDEFIYSRGGFKTIKEYLNSLNNDISQVKVQWKVFGSNGHIEQPETVIKSFTKRVNYDSGPTQGVIINNNNKYSMCKTISRTKYIVKLGIHSHATSINNNISSDNLQTNKHDNNDFLMINEFILNNSYLHLNHYAIQSYTWFMKIKSTRGSAHSIVNDNKRTESYFKAFDINKKEDLELSLKTYSQSESGNVVSTTSSSTL